MKPLIAFLICSIAVGASATTFYVATNGNDSADGSIGTPLLTLVGARTKIRALGALSAPVTVYLRGGRYYMTSAYVLAGSQDSGTTAYPITYQAYTGETPIIIGGIAVTGFTSVTDPTILSRLSASAQTNVQVANLTAQGITGLLPLAQHGSFRWWDWTGQNELWFTDQPMQLAQWTNTTWLMTASAPAPGSDHFSFISSRPATWAASTNIWVHGYFGNTWTDFAEQVGTLAISGTTNTVTTLAPQAGWGYVGGARFKVINVLEELDQANEYFIERTNGLVYFWPPSSITAGNPFVSTVGLGAQVPSGGIITLAGVSNVVLSGLTLEGSVGPSVLIWPGQDDIVTNCTLNGSSCDGVDLINAYRIKVDHCTITGNGQIGVFVHYDVATDRTILTNENNRITYNTMHDNARLSWANHANIYLEGVGSYIGNNLIYNQRHQAMRLFGNNHVVEYNEIHDVCTETGDSGAIYQGLDWTMRGTIIRYNYLHNISVNLSGQSEAFPHVVALYLDDFWSGTTLYGNVLYSVDTGVLLGGGRDNTIQNNIFAECAYDAVLADQRGYSFLSADITDTNSVLWAALNAMPYQNALWSAAYPPLVSIATNNPAAAYGNTLSVNISYSNNAWTDWRDTVNTNITLLNNFTNGDPLFVNYAAHNFALQPDSPAFGYGFQQIPFDHIGTAPVTTVYYAATNGNDSNDGFTISTPKTLSGALNIGPSNTVIVMPGTWTGTEIDVIYPGTTLQSQVKWGAKFYTSPNAGILTQVGWTTIDGFEVAYATNVGIYLACSNSTVRNCWVHHCVTNTGITGSGINCTAGPDSVYGHTENMLYENNLVEHNGAPDMIYNDHGIYVAGTNITIRGNVCRYNRAGGIQVWDHAAGSYGVNVYNNITYSNGYAGYIQGSETAGNSYANVYGNTFMDYYALDFGSGGGSVTVNLTNNIIWGLHHTINTNAGSAYTFNHDYNVINEEYNSIIKNTHDVLTGTLGLVNTNTGLYWLTYGAPAKGAALATACGPVNFFGAAQSSVTDIGAVQYNVLYDYAADKRVLDPSPAAGADYWQILTARPVTATNLRISGGVLR